MGGCLSDPEIRRRRREEKLLEQRLVKAFEQFTSSWSRKDLLSLHKVYGSVGSFFVQYLLDELGYLGFNKHIPNEYKGWEFETKLTVPVGSSKKVVSIDSPRPFMEYAIEHFPKKTDFIRDMNVTYRYSTNHYFVKGDSELVIMASDDNVAGNKNVKHKKKGKDLFLDDPSKIVLKRKDHVTRNVYSKKIEEIIFEATQNGSEFVGFIKRNRARSDVLSSVTGRVYTLFFDNIIAFPPGWSHFGPPRSIHQQMEVEYRGFISTKYEGYVRDQNQIVGDIISLADILIKTMSGKVVEKQHVGTLCYTSEQKVDFLKL